MVVSGAGARGLVKSGTVSGGCSVPVSVTAAWRPVVVVSGAVARGLVRSGTVSGGWSPGARFARVRGEGLVSTAGSVGASTPTEARNWAGMAERAVATPGSASATAAGATAATAAPWLTAGGRGVRIGMGAAAGSCCESIWGGPDDGGAGSTSSKIRTCGSDAGRGRATRPSGGRSSSSGSVRLGLWRTGATMGTEGWTGVRGALDRDTDLGGGSGVGVTGMPIAFAAPASSRTAAEPDSGRLAGSFSSRCRITSARGSGTKSGRGGTGSLTWAKAMSTWVSPVKGRLPVAAS